MLHESEHSIDETVEADGVAQGLSLKSSDQKIPELSMIKQLLTLLEKSFKTTRTYGPNNPVAQRFFYQFYSDLTAYLEMHGSLMFLVQRLELYYKGHSVYHASSQTESLAFRLHADGVRELSFHKGLSQNDLTFFLEAMWAANDEDASDEDIVTRLWGKNLSTITCVTAEEIIKSSDLVVDVLTPQDSQTLNSPPTRLRQVNASETSRGPADKGTASPDAQSNLVGYDVTPQELDALAKEIEAESSRDNITYLLDMLTAILASESSGALLGKLLDVFAETLETLTEQGNWKVLNTFISLLQEAQELCPNLAAEHRHKLSSLVDTMGHADRLKMMEEALNKDPEGSLEDLQALFLMLKPDAVPPLCELLGNLKHKVHRLMVCDVLTTLAKDNCSPLVKGLTDRRWYYVRNVVSIIGKLNNPHLAKSLEPLITHEDVRVRKEVLRTVRTLCPAGHGDLLIAFLSDREESVRLLAVKILTSGQYTASFHVWPPVITSKAFQDRSVSEKRAVFQVMCQTSGEAAVPYCRELVTQWFWANRKSNQEAGTLAAEALKRIGTPAAIAALEAGKKRMNRAIRQACQEALAALSNRR